MKKRVFICLVIIILILGGFYYYRIKSIVKIDSSKISSISYGNEVGKFDITQNLSEKDVNSIVNSLNSLNIRPDENEIGEYTSEYIEMQVLGYRRFRIYKQSDGRATIMYARDIKSNGEDNIKQTTIDSDVLRRDFKNFEELSQTLTLSN
jgi:hypothetical protein